MPVPNSSTVVLLGVFNGERFLLEQLESLCDLNEKDLTLLIRDDGSTDNTLEIIQEFQLKDPRVQLLNDENPIASSALANFSTLLNVAYKQGAEYIFCCDQDDVWEPNKLSLMLAKLKQLEGKEKAPSLVHHDLAVVNESLEPIAPSFINMMQLEPSDQQCPQRLISRNEVTGCAIACNRALLEIALPVSNQAIMHDWWLALCAGYFGRLSFLPDKLVKYRQHDANEIGAKSFWHGLNPFNNWVAGWRRGDDEFRSTVRQANAFKEKVADRLGRDSEAFATLEKYSGLPSATRWQRLKVLQHFGLGRTHWLLNIVLIARMLLLPRTSD